MTSRSTGTIVTARGRGSITAIDSPCFRLLVKLMNSRCHFTLLEVFSVSSPNIKLSSNGGREVTCHEKFGPGVKSGPAGPILVGQNWSAPAKTGPICARMKLRLVIAAALQSRQLWTALMWEISLLRYTNTLQKEGKQKLIVRYLS